MNRYPIEPREFRKFLLTLTEEELTSWVARWQELERRDAQREYPDIPPPWAFAFGYTAGMIVTWLLFP